jgi:hypothetical protein
MKDVITNRLYASRALEVLYRPIKDEEFSQYALPFIAFEVE